MLEESQTLVKDSSKFSIIPLGVDIETINRISPCVLQKPAILFFGHLTHIKGVDLLVEAFEKVNQHNPNAHLYLIGNGNLTEFCNDYVKKTGLTDKVHILGAQSQTTLFSFLKGCDICVLPSRNDAGPLTLLEAMAAGKPIVITAVGFVPEIF
jgi:glycosyltransferase involved in cell wall biosynthesis